ncbi:MAG: ribosome biogenesis GTPase YlqF [Ruminococcaceae bacterium]|nr:ribosome biogenesis GTPase YlqF [Oscillospiraceae bacterium]
MPSETIQWFPGHMAKTRRLISENIKNVDIVIEILDARIPYSSRNPEIARLIGDKPTLLLLNKASLADPAQNASWVKRYTTENTICLLTDCVSGNGINKMEGAIRTILADKLRRYEEKGMNKRIRAMVLGIPNVGKSSLINRICGTKKAKVENRPGVTLDKQWVPTKIGVDLMDMPGILWPKFEERRVGENLALTGAIRDGILDLETMAVILCKRLRRLYPEMLSTRYKLGDMAQYKETSDYDLFLTIGRKRGFLISGGEINTERTAIMLLDEFRDAKIGRITLDRYSKEELPDA